MMTGGPPIDGEADSTARQSSRFVPRFGHYITLAFLVILGIYYTYTRIEFLSHNYKPEFASSEMEKGAASLVKNGTLGNVYSANSGISAHLVPLYPLLLAAVDRVFGIDTEPTWIVEGLLAMLFSGAAIFLLPLLSFRAKLIWGTGLAAVAVRVIGKGQIFLEIRGDWEHGLASLTLILIMLLAIRLHDEGWSDWRLTALWGLLMGLGALLSPSITLPTMMIIMFGDLLTRSASPRHLFSRFAVAGMIAACVISPWVYRNYQAFHKFIPLRSNFGLELYLGNNPLADGGTLTNNLTQHPHGNREELKVYEALGEVEYMRVKQQAAIEWIKAHPDQFLKLCVRRALMFWFIDDIVKTDGTWRGLLGKLKQGMSGILALGGLVWLFWSRNPYRWIFLASLVGPMMTYTITHVYWRYSFPVHGLKQLLSLELVAAFVLFIIKRARGAWRMRNDHSEGVSTPPYKSVDGGLLPQGE